MVVLASIYDFVLNPTDSNLYSFFKAQDLVFMILFKTFLINARLGFYDFFKDLYGGGGCTSYLYMLSFWPRVFSQLYCSLIYVYQKDETKSFLFLRNFLAGWENLTNFPEFSFGRGSIVPFFFSLLLRLQGFFWCHRRLPWKPVFSCQSESSEACFKSAICRCTALN